MQRIARSTLLLVSAALLIAGCHADPARQRSDAAVSLLVDTRSGLIDSEQQVQQSLTALQALRDAQGDVRPAFDRLRDQTAAVHKEADRVRIEADDVRARAEQFTDTWKADVSTISDQRLRQAAEERVGRVQEHYRRINDLYAEVNTAFAAYLRSLEDLQTYLSYDLNIPALQSVRPWLDDAQTAGQSLKDSIGKLTTELNTTANSLAPIPVPQQQPM